MTLHIPLRAHYAFMLFILSVVMPVCAYAAPSNTDFVPLSTILGEVNESVTSAFQSRMAVSEIVIPAPTVVEVPLTYYDFDRRGFMVIENETGRILPSILKERYAVAPTPVSVSYGGVRESYGESLVDGDAHTGKRFELSSNGESTRVEITLTVDAPIVTSGLVFDLERNVSLPTSIEIRGEDALGNALILLSKTSMKTARVSFIPTTVRAVTVSLTYAQPLKLNELTLIQDNPEASVSRGVRFLAQPGMTYTVYGNPDRPVASHTGEAGDLYTDTGVQALSPHAFSRNEVYIPADTDSDGTPDTIDNCVTVANTTQIDINGNGRGDDCDDFDRDGVMNPIDNCVNFPNTAQYDSDGDGVGDVCDAEESRLTERLPWVPWVGMGIAAMVLIGLFAIVALRPVKQRSDTEAMS